MILNDISLSVAYLTDYVMPWGKVEKHFFTKYDESMQHDYTSFGKTLYASGGFFGLNEIFSIDF